MGLYLPVHTKDSAKTCLKAHMSCSSSIMGPLNITPSQCTWVLNASWRSDILGTS